MATFTGWLVEGGIGGETNPNITPAHDQFVLADIWPPFASAAGAYDSDAVATALPIDQVAAGATPGDPVWSFLQDFYYRVHVVPREIRLGPIVQSAERAIEVWSAWFQINTLNAITKVGTGGLTLTGPVAPPTDFLPLDSREYTLSIDINGPASVEAVYTFDFALNDPTLTITGDRVLPWPYSPNWDTAPRERLEWRTNVLRSYNAKERRAQTREAARASYEYTVLQGGDLDRVTIENLLHGWQTRVFGLPLWHQQEYTAAVLPAGSTVVPVSTTDLDYVVGGLAALVEGPQHTEVLEILAVDPGQLTLITGTGAEFPVGTKVAPARFARLPSDMRIGYPSDGIADLVVRFELTNEESYTPAVEADDYRGYSVLLDRRDWSVEVEAAYQRFTFSIDFATGRTALDDRADFAGVTRSHDYLIDGRAALATFRAFLAARSGRRVPLWLPSGHNDFLLLGTAGDTDTSLVVENRRHVQLIDEQVGRRDVMVQLYDGTRFYRRIVGGTIDSDVQETILLDTTLGQTVAPSEVQQISYLALARLSSDAVELSHETDAIARVSVGFEVIRDDVP